MGDGFDIAVRIADLTDSSRWRGASPRCIGCCGATPAYLAQAGRPALSPISPTMCSGHPRTGSLRLQGPDGPVTQAVHSPLRTNSNEVEREAVLAGCGHRPALHLVLGRAEHGALQVVLPAYRASHRVGVFAVYPSRRFLPQKVRVFIDHLAGLYGSVPPWDAGLEHLFEPQPPDNGAAAVKSGWRMGMGPA